MGSVRYQEGWISVYKDGTNGVSAYLAWCWAKTPEGNATIGVSGKVHRGSTYRVAYVTQDKICGVAQTFTPNPFSGTWEIDDKESEQGKATRPRR